MSRRLRWTLAAGAALLVVALLIASRWGARDAPLARAPEALPTTSPRTDVAAIRAAPRAPQPSARPSFAPPSENDDLMPKPGAIRPKDPNGPVRDWRDFTPDERAAVSSMELDLADLGDVIERLESGEEVGRLRGSPVTAEEQQAIRGEVDAFAAAYEKAYDRTYHNETTVIEMAEAIGIGRARLDRRVREIYGLSDAQFYEMFPYRRE